MVPIYALTCALILSSVYAHSWLECSNYDPPLLNITSSIEFDEVACNGYPRGFARQFINGFGVETGYSWPHDNCDRDTFNNKDYTSITPMATYMPNQIVYLAHPAKKHVADICTGANVSPVSLSLRMSNDLNVDTFDTEIDMFGPDHVNGKIDHAGYQFCFDFCSNPDKALCLTSWVIPENITEGVHSFKWTVMFNTTNKESNYYSTCFDAMVASVDTIVLLDNESYSSFSNSDDDDNSSVVISDEITDLLSKSVAEDRLLSEVSSSSRLLVKEPENIIVPKLNLSIEHRPLIHHLITKNATHNVSITHNYTLNATTKSIIMHSMTNDTITFPPNTTIKNATIKNATTKNATTKNATTKNATTPISKTVSLSTSTPLPTPTPYPIPLTLPPEVITSAANHQSPPFANITNQIIHFIGQIDIRGIFNITTRSFGRL